MSPEFKPEYIVIGSGAGGGTVAARLAEEGYRVLVLEAGPDPRAAGGTPDRSNADDYDVPAFHPFATENAAMRWDFFVRHYGNTDQQKRDPNYRETWNGQPVDGVLYPRAGALGGCTAHNAMILVCPHDSDWNQLADLTGDRSWRAEHMWKYFQKLENCDYRPRDRVKAGLGINPSRHGFGGWLNTERAVPRAALRDDDIRSTIIDTARAALESRFRLRSLGNSEADPNDWRVATDDTVGIRFTPMTTKNGVRVGTRERLLEVQERHRDRLQIRTNILVTRILFDATNRATGVAFLEGRQLYRAHPQPGQPSGPEQHVTASREVIVAGGAFNTPQLLMLSGIGPRDTLNRFGIETRVDLPGVGRNLQDRYEVSVMNRMAFDTWSVFDGAEFCNRDRQYREWADEREGVYATNGALLAVVLRSSLERPVPDLFCYAILGHFTGYYPTYSSAFAANPNCLTWVVLKGHTANTAGEVTLRSADPRDTPLINFRYFEEGNDGTEADLQSVVDGIRFVRSLAEPLRQQSLLAREESPGETLTSDDELKGFVRDHAWGHHASCTCPIGVVERGGVLTPTLEVHGTQGLRVVDASVFPRIPGLFIASAVYMVGEKAADMIIADARRTSPPTIHEQ
jgi:choline dehydrogenase-like flavoprotein